MHCRCGQLVTILSTNIVEQIKDGDTVIMTPEIRDIKVVNVASIEHEHVENKEVGCCQSRGAFLFDLFQSRLKQLFLDTSRYPTTQVRFNVVSYGSEKNMVSETMSILTDYFDNCLSP